MGAGSSSSRAAEPKPAEGFPNVPQARGSGGISYSAGAIFNCTGRQLLLETNCRRLRSHSTGKLHLVFVTGIAPSEL